MRRITLFVSFISIVAVAFPGESSGDTLTLRELIQNEVSQYQSEVQYGNVNEFINTLVDELQKYDSESFQVKKYQKFLPACILRHLYFSGDYMNSVRARHIAASFYMDIKSRELRGIPVLSEEQAKPLIAVLNKHEDEITAIVKDIKQSDIKNLDPAMLEHVDLEKYKSDAIHTIRRGIGGKRRALSDPTYTMAPTNLKPEAISTITKEFNKTIKDILDLSLSNEYIEKKYPGISYLSTPIKYPPILSLRRRLRSISQYFAFLDTMLYPNNPINKRSKEAQQEYEKMLDIYEQIDNEKVIFERSFSGQNTITGTSSSKIMKEKIEQYLFKR
jgi:hypothetical protein